MSVNQWTAKKFKKITSRWCESEKQTIKIIWKCHLVLYRSIQIVVIFSEGIFHTTLIVNTLNKVINKTYNTYMSSKILQIRILLDLYSTKVVKFCLVLGRKLSGKNKQFVTNHVATSESNFSKCYERAFRDSAVPASHSIAWVYLSTLVYSNQALFIKYHQINRPLLYSISILKL